MQVWKYFSCAALGTLIFVCHSQPNNAATANQTPPFSNPKNYIGFKYSDNQQISGVEVLGSSIMFSGGAVRNMYGGYHHVKQGQTQMLWLTGKTKAIDKGKPIWVVLDVLTFPKYNQQLNAKTYYLGWGGKCRIRNGLSDANLVAVAVLENKLWLDQVKQAWRLNRKTGKFEPYSIKNMRCENPNLS
jgi:hypothetical protein